MIYLTEAYAIDNNSILRILTQNKQINRSDPDYSYYAKLATWANENGRQQKLKNIDLSAIKLSDNGLIKKHKLTTRYTTLGHLLNDLKNLMDQEGKYTPGSEMSQLVQQTTLDILTELSKPKSTNTYKPDAEAETDEPKLYAGMDWTAEKARRLEAGGTPSEVLNKFYNDYYLIEYAGGTNAGIVTKLKSLDKILIPEFNALGYNPDVNPLAQFLKILIKLRAEKKSTIFDELTTNSYGAIHNSFKDRYITGNMLGNYSSTNILFCNDLYNYKGPDIVNYLMLQSQTINEAKNNPKYSDDKLLVARMFFKQELPDTQGKSYESIVNDLLNLTDVITLTNPKSGVKLRSIAEIRELYRHLFKSVPKKPLNKSTVPEIVRLAIEQGAIQDMISYILDISEFDDEYEQEIKKWLSATKYRPNYELAKRGKKILSGYKLNNAIDALALIIARLQKYYEEASK